MPKRGKKKPRKIKYYKKYLKIPESQNKKLRKFCLENQLTENKVFRTILKEYLQRNVQLVKLGHQEASPNQLTLFDFKEDDITSTGT